MIATHASPFIEADTVWFCVVLCGSTTFSPRPSASLHQYTRHAHVACTAAHVACTWHIRGTRIVCYTVYFPVCVSGTAEGGGSSQGGGSSWSK